MNRSADNNGIKNIFDIIIGIAYKSIVTFWTFHLSFTQIAVVCTLFTRVFRIYKVIPITWRTILCTCSKTLLAVSMAILAFSMPTVVKVEKAHFVWEPGKSPRITSKERVVIVLDDSHGTPMLHELCEIIPGTNAHGQRHRGSRRRRRRRGSTGTTVPGMPGDAKFWMRAKVQRAMRTCRKPNSWPGCSRTSYASEYLTQFNCIWISSSEYVLECYCLMISQGRLRFQTNST